MTFRRRKVHKKEKSTKIVVRPIYIVYPQSVYLDDRINSSELAQEPPEPEPETETVSPGSDVQEAQPLAMTSTAIYQRNLKERHLSGPNAEEYIKKQKLQRAKYALVAKKKREEKKNQRLASGSVV